MTSALSSHTGDPTVTWTWTPSPGDPRDLELHALSLRVPALLALALLGTGRNPGGQAAPARHTVLLGSTERAVPRGAGPQRLLGPWCCQPHCRGPRALPRGQPQRAGSAPPQLLSASPRWGGVRCGRCGEGPCTEETSSPACCSEHVTVLSSSRFTFLLEIFCFEVKLT